MLVRSVDDAFKELRIHLRWVKTPWIAFVWAEDGASSEALLTLVRQELEGRGHELRLLRPSSPDTLLAAVEQVTAPREPGTCVWLESMHSDDQWQDAWVRLLQRLNRSRERKRLLRAAGGLVLSMPRAFKTEVAGCAPDLWSARSLALEFVEETAPELDWPRWMTARPYLWRCSRSSTPSSSCCTATRRRSAGARRWRPPRSSPERTSGYTHFCVSVIDLMESLILGYAALGRTEGR
jgi:hypothetical protein